MSMLLALPVLRFRLRVIVTKGELDGGEAQDCLEQAEDAGHEDCGECQADQEHRELYGKTERTRQSIIDAYVQMMREMPYEKITVTELRRRVGIVRSTFYVYFPSTYAVIDEIERTVLAKSNIALTRSNGPTGDRLHTPRCMVEWLQACYECPPYSVEQIANVCNIFRAGSSVLDVDIMRNDAAATRKV